MKYGQRPQTPDQTIKWFNCKWTTFPLANHYKIDISQLKSNEVGDLTIQPWAIQLGITAQSFNEVQNMVKEPKLQIKQSNDSIKNKQLFPLQTTVK
jgi:hypothetical protein